MINQNELDFLILLKECLTEDIEEKVGPSGGYVEFIYNGVTYKIETHCGRENEIKLTPIYGDYLPVDKFGIFSKQEDGTWVFNSADFEEPVSEPFKFELTPEHIEELKKYLKKLAEKCKSGNIMQQFNKSNA